MFYRPRVGDYYKQYTCRAREALLDKFNCSKFLKQVQLLSYKHIFCVFITGIDFYNEKNDVMVLCTCIFNYVYSFIYPHM